MSSAPRATVRHALIPCGGRGTRMQAVAGSSPKELLPIAGISLVEWVARECAASGASELLVVTAPGKHAIRERLTPHTGSPGFPVRIEFIEQPEPVGLMDAIRLGRAFSSGDPIAVALPDNLFVGDAPGLAQVIETYYRTGKNVVGVVEQRPSDATRRGATAPIEGVQHGDEFTITAIHAKGTKPPTRNAAHHAATVAGIGRFVFTDEVWDAIDEVARALAAGAELDDIPVLQHLLAADRLVGRRMRGQFLDVGLPAGYEEATRIIRRPPRPSAPTGELA
jgi:UTP--glucose-1-phosphate uridylyltransferase